MNLTDSLTEASQYTGAIFQRIGELLILIIASIIPIVNILTLGYYARVVRDDPSSKSPPKVEGYMNLFMEGLKIVVVVIIWAIIIAIISFIIAVPFLAFAIPVINWNDPSYWTTPANFLPLIPFIVVFAIIAFLLGIVAFMGIVHMMKRDSFGKAFAFGEIFSITGRIGWLRYLAYFVISFLVSAIAGTISSAIPGLDG